MPIQIVYVDSVTKALPDAVSVSPTQVASVKPSGGDDAAAIQAAIDLVGTSGTVVLAAGTFSVLPPAQGRALTAKPGVTITGNGATIKVANGSPAYEAVIGHDAANDVSGFTVRGVTFDLNSANNAATGVVANESRNAIKIQRGTGIRILGCTFKNVDGTNTVTCNGSTSGAPPVVSDVHIIGNTFTNVGGNATHDHSTIYAHAEGVHVSGNTFYGRATLSPSAVCAIEVHGSGSRVVGNHVDSYREAVNVTGIAYRSNALDCSGNTIVRCLRGIRIFSQAINSGVSPALRSCTVRGNTMHLDVDTWTAIYDVEPYGVAFITTTDHAVNGLSITGNVMECNTYSASSTNVARLTASGVLYSRAGGTTNPDRNVVIRGNVIHGFPACGVCVTGAKVIGLHIADNTVSDTGHATIATPDYKAGVYVGGEAKNATIADNTILDTRASGLMARGVSWLASSGSTGGVIVDNNANLTMPSSGSRDIFIGSSSGAPFIRQRYTFGNVTLPTNAVAARSTAIVASTGVESVQTAAPSGTTWTTVTP